MDSKLPWWRKLVRLPLRLLPHLTEIRVRSGMNRGFHWVTGASINACWLGTYEKDKQELAARRVVPGSNIWDIGANVGFYTLGLSRLTGPQGHVYAFEPLGNNIAYLLHHVRRNALANVTVVQSAVADEVSMVGFTVGTHSSMGHMMKGAGQYQVPTISMDAYVARFPASAPALVKIDVEGAEAQVLAGAVATLAAHRPELWIALHSQTAQQDCAALLRKCGYRTTLLDGRPAPDQLEGCDEIIALPG